MHERQIILNELAQGIRPVPDGIAWFAGLPEAEQRLALTELVQFSLQARAVRTDAEQAIARSGIRPTYTPALSPSPTPVGGRAAAPLVAGMRGTT